MPVEEEAPDPHGLSADLRRDTGDGGSRKLLFPLKPRREGAVFDGFVSNAAADRFPLEQLRVPTLVISARDEPVAPYRYAAAAAPRIPGARLVTVERGGHLFLGHDAEVKAINGFAAPEHAPAWRAALGVPAGTGGRPAWPGGRPEGAHSRPGARHP